MLTFDPKNVNLIYGGARIDGYADGTFIKVEYNDDRYKLTMGADGLGARSRSNDKSAKITITLMPNSIGNKILDAAAKLDDASNAGSLPLALTDLANGDLFISPGAWVMKDPGREIAKETQPIEWVLETDSLSSAHGAAL